MRNPIKCLGVAMILCLAASIARAETTPRILVLDLAKVFDNHWKTQEQREKFQADGSKAKDQLAQIQKEGNDLVEQYKELDDQSKNPTATADAKAKAQAAAQKKYDEIQQKRSEQNSFIQSTKDAFQQREQTFKTLLLEEITKVAVEVAKGRGATLLLDKSGPTLMGVSNVLYFDPGLDITDEVMAKLNLDRPAASAPSAQPPGDSPKITLPGTAPTK